MKQTVHRLSIDGHEKKSQRNKREACKGGGVVFASYLLPGQVFLFALASSSPAIPSARSPMDLVQSLNSPFVPPHIGAEAGRAKKRVQDILHAHAQNKPIKNY